MLSARPFIVLKRPNLSLNDYQSRNPDADIFIINQSLLSPTLARFRAQRELSSWGHQSTESATVVLFTRISPRESTTNDLTDNLVPWDLYEYLILSNCSNEPWNTWPVRTNILHMYPSLLLSAPNRTHAPYISLLSRLGANLAIREPSQVPWWLTSAMAPRKPPKWSLSIHWDEKRRARDSCSLHPNIASWIDNEWSYG